MARPGAQALDKQANRDPASSPTELNAEATTRPAAITELTAAVAEDGLPVQQRAHGSISSVSSKRLQDGRRKQ